MSLNIRSHFAKKSSDTSMISAPALGSRWWASQNNGAYKSFKDQVSKIEVSKIDQISESQVLFTGTKECLKKWPNFQKILDSAWRERGVGDFWGHCLVAEGAAESLIDPIVNIWDVAALYLLVSEAGGEMTDDSGFQSDVIVCEWRGWVPSPRVRLLEIHPTPVPKCPLSWDEYRSMPGLLETELIWATILEHQSIRQIQAIFDFGEGKILIQDNEDDILNGKFNVALLKKSKFKPQIADIIKISIEKIYESKEVIEKEVAGYNIINKLLDTFISSVNRYYEGSQTSYDDLIIKLLPSTTNLNHDNLYSRLLEICHYVASLSDRKALNVYNKITGVEYQ